MGWNYDFILSESLVLISMFIYYILRPRLPMQAKKLFLRMLLIEGIVLVSDALGSYAIDHWMNNTCITYGVNIIYFASFFLRAYLFFKLSLTLLKIRYKENKYLKWFMRVTTIILIGLTLTTPFTKLIFYLDDGYYRGVLYPLTYLQMYFNAMIVFYFILKYSSQIEQRDQFIAVIMWGILIIGYIVRYFFTHALIANLFYLLVLIIIFFNYTDPSAYIDDESQLYNQRGFTEMMSEKIEEEKYHIFICVIKNQAFIRDIYMASDISHAMKEIGIYLKTILTGTNLFYLNSGVFIALSDQIISTSLQEKIANRFHSNWKGSKNRLYLDVGFVRMDYTLPIHNTDELLQNLYAAVDQVSNVNGPLELDVERIRRQIKVRSVLDNALKNNEILLYLQPIVDAKTHEVVGGEALARLYDSELGIIYPNEFISYADENGSIGSLGMQMFTKACAFMKKYGETTGIQWINVNLSPIQCLDRNLATKFERVLDKYSLPASKIHLEVTEEAFIDSNILGERIRVLKEKGFLIALDDFGSGYANLARVTRYPLDSIKIDRSLIVSYFEHPNDVLVSLVRTLKSLGYYLVAEGVEDEYMVKEMTKIGVDYMQGYYYSKPIPVKQFVEKYTK